jgi:hypothetical protein
MELVLILGLGLPILIIGGVWAILRDVTRTSRVATETKNAVNVGLEELRAEVLKLRDTSTQYDMSLERTLTELRQRIEHIESRTELPVSSRSQSPSPQIQTPNQDAEQIITLGH